MTDGGEKMEERELDTAVAEMRAISEARFERRKRKTNIPHCRVKLQNKGAVSYYVGKVVSYIEGSLTISPDDSLSFCVCNHQSVVAVSLL